MEINKNCMMESQKGKHNPRLILRSKYLDCMHGSKLLTKVIYKEMEKTDAMKGEKIFVSFPMRKIMKEQKIF